MHTYYMYNVCTHTHTALPPITLIIMKSHLEMGMLILFQVQSPVSTPLQPLSSPGRLKENSLLPGKAFFSLFTEFQLWTFVLEP